MENIFDKGFREGVVSGYICGLEDSMLKIIQAEKKNKYLTGVLCGMGGAVAIGSLIYVINTAKNKKNKAIAKETELEIGKEYEIDNNLSEPDRDEKNA